MYHEGPFDPFRLRFIAYRKSVGPVTQKRIAIESHPLARELLAVLPEPFLFRQPGSLRRYRDRDVGDGQHHMLLLGERQRFERSQETVLEYSFQMLRHYLILPLTTPSDVGKFASEARAQSGRLVAQAFGLR